MVKNILKNGKLLILRRQTNILSAAFVIMLAYAGSGLLGLFRNRLLAATFFGGNESQLDVYFAAFVVPDTLFQMLITGSLSAAFIPVFSEYLKKGQNQASEFASSAINIISIIFFCIVAIFFLLSPVLSRLIAPSLETSNLLLLSQLLRMLLLAQIFFTLSGFMTAIIQSHQRFLITALAPIVYNLGIIFGILFLSSSLGIFGPAVGVVIGSALHFIIQIPLTLKLGFTYKPVLDFNHPGLKKIRKLMPLRSLTLASGQIERFLAVSIATSLAAGSLTIFNFARQLYLLPVALFGTTIGQASFPTMSAEIASQKKEEFQKTLISSILQVLYFSLPAAVIILILRLPAVRIAFGARNFPWDATLLTSKVVASLAFAIPTLSLNSLLIRAFYSIHDTKTPFYISLLGGMITIFLSLFFSLNLNYGVIGIAVAISISSLIQSVILTLSLNKRLIFLTAHLVISSVKIIIATLATGVFLWVPMRVIDRFILDTTRTINLLILTGTVLAIGMLVYLNISAILHIEQLSEVVTLGHRIGNWRKVLEESEEMLESTNLEKPVS